MSKYGSPDLQIQVDDSGDTARDLSEYIDTIDGFEIEALTQESTAFGDEWAKHLSAGIKQANEITLEGFFDDADNGPDAVLSGVGDTRGVTITWGGTESDTFDAIIRTYSKNPTTGELTRFNCTLQPTGEVT